MKFKNKKKFFFVKKLDSHINIELLWKIRISIKLKSKIKVEEANEYGLNNKESRSEKIIVSLTSFPDRIHTIHYTIASLLNQTCKPDKLILWLATEQFNDKKNSLPDNLLKLEKYGLEIKWCENIYSYKKLIPTLREFPNDIIVTADDDIYYQKDWLSSLYNSYLKNKTNIYTRRACALHKKNSTIYITPHYANFNNHACYNNQLMGGAGTLYPPNSLHNDIFNIEKIKSLTPTHDDIYFWAMAVLNNTKIACVKNKDLNINTIENTQDSGLCKINKVNGAGMSPHEAFEKIFQEYPEILEKLKNE